MIRWIVRLAMAIATLIVLARAAAAHEPPGPYPDYEQGAAHSPDEDRPVAWADAPATGCDPDRPFHPDDPLACPPGWGEVYLPASFFIGGGGVGPEVIYIGGGGGGGGYAYASASAGGYAFASASASARVRVGGRPPRRGGGCGCH